MSLPRSWLRGLRMGDVPPQTPAYVQLAASLKDSLQRGEFGDDGPLPSEAELVASSGLSRQTVRRAYLELTAAGLVTRARGRGTFAASVQPKYMRGFDSVQDLMGFDLDTRVEVVRELERGTSIETAARLSLATDIVYALEYLRSHRGVPFAWTTVSLPPEIAERLVDSGELLSLGSDRPLTVISLLEQRLGIEISAAEQTITAASADDRIARRLHCDVGAPVLRIDRLYLGPDERPVELSVGYFLPSQYTHRTRLHRT